MSGFDPMAEAIINNAECERGPMRTVLFHRDGFFYPIDLPLYDDLGAHAECNPGTLMVTDPVTGDILWRPQ